MVWLAFKAGRHGHHPDPQERTLLERELPARPDPQRHAFGRENALGGPTGSTGPTHHARSRIKATMRGLKSFGERIASRDPDRQMAEVHLRVAVMNRFSALGTAQTERVMSSSWARGHHASTPKSATTIFQWAISPGSSASRGFKACFQPDGSGNSLLLRLMQILVPHPSVPVG